MRSLIDGYHRFRATGWPQRRQRFEALADQGQRPDALVITCVDSRVDPTVIFDAAPGQILTVRNVANLVPPYQPDGTYHGTSAALEFGVRVLGIPHLVVLGHGQCGGVQALLQGPPPEATDFIMDWMAIAAPAREVAMRHDPAERQQCCEHECIRTSLANLRGFPWIAERIAAGTLTLHGAWFAIRTGILTVLQPDGAFRPAEPA
jgi:carbonic anhydrase